MGILMVGLVKPEVDRHISKKFQKTEKKVGHIDLRHFFEFLILGKLVSTS